MRTEGDYHPTNREKSREPKMGTVYCYGCDGALVGDDQTCPRCGWKNKKGRAPARDARHS